MYWITGILGLILTGAPWLFGYSNNSGAMWTSVLVGLATVVVSIIEGAQAEGGQWEYWTAGVLGIIAVVAPFALGFSGYSSAMWSSVAMGVLIALFAGSRLTSMSNQ